MRETPCPSFPVLFRRYLWLVLIKESPWLLGGCLGVSLVFFFKGLGGCSAGSENPWSLFLLCGPSWGLHAASYQRDLLSFLLLVC